jgi:four helix bundle protein
MEKKIRNFQDLEVWQVAHRLALGTYRLAAKLPVEERYGLALQMKKAAVSVPANISEGFGRRSAKEKLQFLTIARGSLTELNYYFILGRDLGYWTDCEDCLDQVDHISRMLYNRSARIRFA